MSSRNKMALEEERTTGVWSSRPKIRAVGVYIVDSLTTGIRPGVDACPSPCCGRLVKMASWVASPFH